MLAFWSVRIPVNEKTLRVVLGGFVVVCAFDAFAGELNRSLGKFMRIASKTMKAVLYSGVPAALIYRLLILNRPLINIPNVIVVDT